MTSLPVYEPEFVYGEQIIDDGYVFRAPKLRKLMAVLGSIRRGTYVQGEDIIDIGGFWKAPLIPPSQFTTNQDGTDLYTGINEVVYQGNLYTQKVGSILYVIAPVANRYLSLYYGTLATGSYAQSMTVPYDYAGGYLKRITFNLGVVGSTTTSVYLQVSNNNQTFTPYATSDTFVIPASTYQYSLPSPNFTTPVYLYPGCSIRLYISAIGTSAAGLTVTVEF